MSSPPPLEANHEHLKNAVDIWIKKHSGFDYDEKNALVDQLTCIVCQDLFENPKQHKTCQNILCLKCWEQIVPIDNNNPLKKKCLYCQDEFSLDQLEKPSNIVNQMLDGFPMRCKECHEPCQRQSVKLHMNEKCMRLCGHCEDKETKFNSETYLDHLQKQCPSCPLECVAKDADCPWISKGETELQAHLATCAYVQLRAKILDLKSQIKQLQLPIQKKQLMPHQPLPIEERIKKFGITEDRIISNSSGLVNVTTLAKWVTQWPDKQSFEFNFNVKNGMELRVQLKSSKNPLNATVIVYFCVIPFHPVYQNSLTPDGSSKTYSELYSKFTVGEIVNDNKKIFSMKDSEFKACVGRSPNNDKDQFKYTIYIYIENN
jgi:hypothetical protein